MPWWYTPISWASTFWLGLPETTCSRKYLQTIRTGCYHPCFNYVFNSFHCREFAQKILFTPEWSGITPRSLRRMTSYDRKLFHEYFQSRSAQKPRATYSKTRREVHGFLRRLLVAPHNFLHHINQYASYLVSDFAKEIIRFGDQPICHYCYSGCI